LQTSDTIKRVTIGSFGFPDELGKILAGLLEKWGAFPAETAGDVRVLQVILTGQLIQAEDPSCIFTPCISDGGKAFEPLERFGQTYQPQLFLLSDFHDTVFCTYRTGALPGNFCWCFCWFVGVYSQAISVLFLRITHNLPPVTHTLLCCTRTRTRTRTHQRPGDG
jgi:hypothetical protein